MNPATDAYIQALPEWQANNLSSFRQLIHQVCPDVTEEIKWGVPVFVYKSKMLFSMASFKQHSKYNFMFNGALISDTHNLFNNGLESKKSRSIDLQEGQSVNAAQLKDLVVQAVNQVS